MQGAVAPVTIPREMLALVPEFNGDTKVLNLFLGKCEYVIQHYQGTVQRNEFLMHHVTSKLRGKAAELVSERGGFESYDELKAILIQHFGDPRSEECVAIELETLKIRHNEPYLEFCGRIQEVRAILLAKVNQNQLNTAEVKRAKRIIHDNTSLNVFLYNLPEHMVRLVRLKNPPTLEDALKHVLEEVNFQEQYNLRSKMLQNKNTSQNATPPVNFKPPIHFNQPAQPQFKFGIPTNQFTPKPQFTNQPTVRPQIMNFGYRPPQQFGFRPNFNSGPQQAQQFAPRTPQFGFRPGFQVSQNGFRPQAGQFGYRPPQLGFRPQVGQFGYRPPQPQGYRQPTGDVTMRTAPALPQRLPINEMYSYTTDEGEETPAITTPDYYDGIEYTYLEPQPQDATGYYEMPLQGQDTEYVYENEREEIDAENFCLAVSPKTPR